MLRKSIRSIAGFGLAVALAVTTWPGGVAVAGSCPVDLPQGGEAVTLDPADFTGPIDNPYWPMAPGATWTFGHFTDVLLTKDDTPIHPEILEYKLYAKDVGPVLVFGVSGGSGTEELVSFDPGTV